MTTEGESKTKEKHKVKQFDKMQKKKKRKG